MSEAPAAAPVTENGAPPTQEVVQEEPGFKVFVGNLAYVTTEEGLRTFFEPVKKDIISAQVIMRGTRSAGYGFVALATNEAVEKAAAELDKKELDGRQLQVQPAKGKEQKELEKKERKAKRKANRRGNKAVTGEVTDAEANGQSAPEGAPADGEKKKKKKSKSKAKKADGEAAAATDAETPAGEGEKKARKAKKARTPRPAGEQPDGEPSKNMLFVANLGFNVDDAGLSALFTDAGITVNSARIVRKRWGKPRRSKGFGFVDVGDEEAQKKAIAALDGKDIDGRPIAVKVAVNAPPESESDGAPTDGAPAATAPATATPAPAAAPAQGEATQATPAATTEAN